MSATRIAGAALVGILALGACGPKPGAETTDAHVDVLGSMMASESEINALFAPTTVRPKTALRAPATNDNYDPQPAECIVVNGNAMAWLYHDSGYREFREIQLADNDDHLEIDQAITAFDSPKDAQALVTRTTDIWRLCAGVPFTATNDGGATRHSRVIGTPTVVDGIDITHDEPARRPYDKNYRAILAVANLVVDLRVSGEAATEAKTAQLARIIADRNAL